LKEPLKVNRLDAVIHQRTTDRLKAAQARASRVVNDAKDRDVEISVVGSLARNSFQVHSDIDFLVYGSAEPRRRAMVERLVADHMRGVDIPYDLIFEADISPERLQEILHDVV
jgi:predicted nucleotidyltransferase